ncbi:MAG: hypothetical protein LC130_23780 [Bryobacterales bacterium]|nr:hypothetical protein [Bryobacterales bacterium]
MFPLIKQPGAIFGLPTRDPDLLSEFDRYLSQVGTALQRCSWDRDVLEMLDLLPQIFLRLDDSVELGADSLPVLYRHMYVVLQVYQRRWSATGGVVSSLEYAAFAALDVV